MQNYPNLETRSGWKSVFGVVAIVAFALPLAHSDLPGPRERLCFQADFEGADALRDWNGPGVIESGYRSEQALAIARDPDAAAPAAIVSVRLPVEAMRGWLVRGSAMVRADAVSDKPRAWNGIKCMLAIETPDQKLWPQASIETGTFDWRRVAFTARVPTNATSATLVLGLEQVTGKVWFDNVKVALATPPILRETRPVTGPPFTGHSLPRLRGTMISPNIDPEGLRLLGREWGANLIRWQLIRHGRPGQVASVEDYERWLEGELEKLDAALPHCEEHGLYVVVDLHSPPGGKPTSGGYVGSDDRLFTDPGCQAKFVEVWKRIATRYKGARAIWGFDLVNEPVEDFVEEGCDEWQTLAERAARAIRAIDPQRTIIVEPSSWGGPGGLNDLAPLPLSNVVYSVHMYLPHAFTHQGVYGPGPALKYPGVIEGKHWDKTELEAALGPVVEFQRAYGVHIYVGEFSAIRWAPGESACRYLKDLIDIFEAQGWDWTYHAFREWSGWSVEHGPDRANTAPVAEPTDRQRLLQYWFAQNQKPTWGHAVTSAPYPPSPVIERIDWAPPESITRVGKGSDNWPITWADDDALYTAYGDGYGFEPLLKTKLSLGFAKVLGTPPQIRGVNLLSETGEAFGDGKAGRKASGILCVDGVLYLLVRNVGNSQLGWSADHGATWTWADWKFTESFGCPTFLNFGRNYSGARDEFVYIYSPDHDSAYERADRFVLARVPKSRLRERAAYEFFVKLGGDDQPVWTTNVLERGAVFSNPGACYRSGIAYNPGVKRYLWCQTGLGEDTRFSGGLAIYDAPEPWGPWTTAFHADTWDVGPGESSSLPAKWMSSDGYTVHLAFSGDDHFSVRKGTITPRKDVVPASP